ncbi:MAG TPA: hypothetical protein VFD59_19180 [Nocardioidaceae bacterium]|nr:hypothetical protein [Nocardioidaceae bacterium]
MMNAYMTLGQLADFAMPICDGGSDASVRVLHDVTNAAVIKGAFPGTPAWSPPN